MASGTKRKEPTQPDEVDHHCRLWKLGKTSIVVRALPSLLVVADPALLLNSRTHKTYALDHGVRKGLTMLDIELGSYKRLETLGDALLSAQATLAIVSRRPHFDSTAITRVRSCLTGNIALSFLSKAYGLPGLALYLGDVGVNQNVAADLFEAHVGASYLDCCARGCLELWERWLYDVFSPDVFPEAYELGEASSAVHYQKNGVYDSVHSRDGTFVPPFLVPLPPHCHCSR